MSEVWFRACSVERIRTIDHLRGRGLSWESVAQAVGASPSHVSRWHRAYLTYGEERFAR